MRYMGFCTGYGKQTFGENGPFRSHFSVSNRTVCRSCTEFKAFMGRIQQKAARIRCKNELRHSAKISVSPRLTPTTVFKLNLGTAWRDLTIISWEQVTNVITWCLWPASDYWYYCSLLLTCIQKGVDRLETAGDGIAYKVTYVYHMLQLAGDTMLWMYILINATELGEERETIV